MIRGRILWPVATVAALLLACTQPEPAETTSDAATQVAEAVDVAAVAQAMDAIEEAYITSYNAGDAAGVAALFAEDGTQAPPLSAALDRAGVEAALMEQFVPGVSFVLEVEREDMLVAGDMTAGWGAFTVTATAEGAEPSVYSGRYGVICRQDPDGTWKILRHMYNYEVPPPGLGE
jgi:ketosteroid isomerase-like protein